MSQILQESMRRLSVVSNTATGLAHPNDEARAKELFKALRQEGEPLQHDTIAAVAIELGWPARHAQALAELGQRIGDGGRVQIKHPKEWGAATVSKVKQDLGLE